MPRAQGARTEDGRPPPLHRERTDWYRIENKAAARADVYIYDEIGFWGTTARDFAGELAEITAPEILLHLNTVGGDVFDGLAIYNGLRDHPAHVEVIVDGLAASAGSFIAQAGDLIRMNRGAQMMIHDANGIVVGNAHDMAAMAARLAKVSDSIAGIYAARSGTSVTEWRDAMRAETWYTAEEAVDAGLADELADAPEDEAAQAVARFDLGIFNYAGRGDAPAPPRRPAQAPATPTRGPGTHDTRGAGTMDLAKIREALAGLPDDASDEQITAALTAEGLPTASAAPPAPAPASEDTPARSSSAPAPAGAGVITVDAAVIDSLKQQAQLGE